MSDHVDGDAPALARDAAGVRLTDEQAACLARWAIDMNDADVPASQLDPAGVAVALAVQGDLYDDEAIVATEQALARVVLAWWPVVAAARALRASGIGHWAAEKWTTPDGEDHGVECGKCRAEWYQGGPDGDWYCDHRPGCVAAALDAAVRALDGDA